MPGLGERERHGGVGGRGGRDIGRKGKGREADRDKKWRQDKKEVNEREEKREDGVIDGERGEREKERRGLERGREGF